jgi:hypothetical protein
MLSPERGADTLLWLLDGTPGRDWEPGGYYERRRPGRASPQVHDALAARLWDASARLVGLA